MREVRTSELQSQLVDLLDDVEQGETIVITRDGRPVARLVPEMRTLETDRTDGRKAVDDLRAWRKSLPQSILTIEDILSARDEGRR
ncbi:MAG: type II toxin-antitoxin system Phd/YefM family antitoxin [Mesorhizobium sp.]